MPLKVSVCVRAYGLYGASTTLWSYAPGLRIHWSVPMRGVRVSCAIFNSDSGNVSISIETHPANLANLAGAMRFHPKLL